MQMRSLVALGVLTLSIGACTSLQNPATNLKDTTSVFATEKSEARNEAYTRGVAYHHGIGVAENHEIAKNYYEQAIKQNGDTRAMNELAVLLMDDDTYVQNLPRAMKLLNQAAKEGNSSARYNLGVASYYGYARVAKNQDRGMDLISTSANQGNLHAQAFLINWLAYDSRVDIKTNPVLRQRVQAWADKGMIEYWDISTQDTEYGELWARFFETDLADRSVMLSDILAVESGCKECKSSNKHVIARKLNEIQTWRMGAANGERSDQFNLGVAYLTGEGVPLNKEEGARLMITAAEAGYVPAQYMLGKLYLEGRGIQKNETMAYAWFNIAAADTWGYQETTWAKAMRDWIANNLPPRHVTAGQDWSVKWLADQAAKQGR